MLRAIRTKRSGGVMQGLAKRRYAAGLNSELFKALAHPLRYPILMIAGEREVTPTELAEMLGEPFQRVYNQVRAMSGGDEPLLELVDTDRRNGGEMHYFRAVVRPVVDATAWEELPQLAREAWSAITCGVIIGEVAASVRSGRFDAHPNRITLRRPLRLDSEGARKVEAAAIAYDEACIQAELESAERCGAGGDSRAEMVSATLLFERADD
jgi:hypothetical protein